MEQMIVAEARVQAVQWGSAHHSNTPRHTRQISSGTMACEDCSVTAL